MRESAEGSMHEFTPEGRGRIEEIAARHGFSVGAAAAMFEAVDRGDGRMAQFDHPEFGGAGQWMRGGMTMIGTMFDAALKARVAQLCEDLARLRGDDAHPQWTPNAVSRATAARGGAGRWWPAELGMPDTSGAQNDGRYAFFARHRRLAIESGGRLTLYDTLDHRIDGVAQQQSGNRTLTFRSQHGPVDLATLPVVTGAPSQTQTQTDPHLPPVSAAHSRENPSGPPSAEPSGAAREIIAMLEQLAVLERNGILTAAEFAAKKTELLKRL
jgi:hypothetical protein